MLEAQQVPPALLQLVYGLQQALLPLGLEAATREYRPHLTLSRDYRGQPPEASSAPEFYLTARHFTLYESRKGLTGHWRSGRWRADPPGEKRLVPDAYLQGLFRSGDYTGMLW